MVKNLSDDPSTVDSSIKQSFDGIEDPISDSRKTFQKWLMLSLVSFLLLVNFFCYNNQISIQKTLEKDLKITQT